VKDSHKILSNEDINKKYRKGKFFKKPILDIHIDKIPYPKITITDKIKVAVRIELTIKKNQKFFYSQNK